MGLFRKNKQEPAEIEFVIPEPVHTHVWKDMPWYMNVHFHSGNKTAGYEIIEPYVCITCGERKNIKLEGEEYTSINRDEREKLFAEIRKQYDKYLQPRAIVEDMIANLILIKDVNHLNMIERIHNLPYRNVGSSADTLKKEDESDFRIKLPERYKK